MNLPRKYRYKYKKYLAYGAHWYYQWSLVGKNGGVHLSIRSYKNVDGKLEYLGGVEYHHRKPPEYMANIPPSHDDCWLLKTPCWHDGTSSYASEKYIPMFLRKCDDEEIFAELVKDADNVIG